ncbi:hypothetical protein F0U44_19560 [Nocardioides humilatus]|uniref:DoxX family protein n=1 Tax=Nocardioides humilatus TaxID=2607660 RepID=A0A5B1L7T1_9ACTN|nr:hypothetical protein [Nocardioides humilatus]KAA1415840.1 hypothetical protein F0U44_19560 [Nocardioides humilatus]
MASPTSLVPLRVFAAAIALPQAVIGVWAVLSPRGWFDDFPGIGPALAAAEPPFNAHLVTDAGSGFLATGVLLLGASLVGGLAEIRVAAIGYLLFCVPHLVWHAAHPSDLLAAGNDVLNVVLIGAQAAGALLLIVLASRGGGVRAPEPTQA